MQNENRTATDSNVIIIEDLTLNETIATQVKGGASIDMQGRLIVGTDQGVYRSGTGTLTLTGVIHG